MTRDSASGEEVADKITRPGHGLILLAQDAHNSRVFSLKGPAEKTSSGPASAGQESSAGTAPIAAPQAWHRSSIRKSSAHCASHETPAIHHHPIPGQAAGARSLRTKRNTPNQNTNTQIT